MGEGGRSKYLKCKQHVNEISKILKIRKSLFELFRKKWMVNKNSSKWQIKLFKKRDFFLCFPLAKQKQEHFLEIQIPIIGKCKPYLTLIYFRKRWFYNDCWLRTSLKFQQQYSYNLLNNLQSRGYFYTGYIDST